MELTDEDLTEFIEIWKDEFKEDLSLGDARHHASQLLELYMLLAGSPDRRKYWPTSGLP